MNALTAKSSYTLTDGVLRNGATIVDTGVLAFCDLADEQTTTAPDELLYLKQNTTNTAALIGAHGDVVSECCGRWRFWASPRLC